MTAAAGRLDVRPLAGRCRVPGDKSISHRAALVAGLARGVSELRGFSPAGDCLATLGLLEALGCRVERGSGVVHVLGGRLEPPAGPTDCVRSGTTMRLGAGTIAAHAFSTTLTGDLQLLRRPMGRVAEPLRSMGARVELAAGDRPPIRIEGGELHGIRYELPVASAQVKSAILLAGLGADGETTVVESAPSRDHTERLLEWLGALHRREPGVVSVVRADLGAFGLDVPGDLSSAAPLVAAAALVPGSDIRVEGVGLNPSRTGFLNALARMGARVETSPIGVDGPEPSGELRVRAAPLHAISVEAGEVPNLIDELPLVGVLATQAEGATEVRGAVELRTKESDRIAGLVAGLVALGADAEELPDGFVVRGPVRLHGGACDALGDHRLAMAFTVAGLVASEPVRVAGMASVGDSFPGFLRALEALT
jgi:3-phosphoshikimate 1-carboxyvinyltransferase